MRPYAPKTSPSPESHPCPPPVSVRFPSLANHAVRNVSLVPATSSLSGMQPTTSAWRERSLECEARSPEITSHACSRPPHGATAALAVDALVRVPPRMPEGPRANWGPTVQLPMQGSAMAQACEEAALLPWAHAGLHVPLLHQGDATLKAPRGNDHCPINWPIAICCVSFFYLLQIFCGSTRN
jgi:hypothetical protein